MPPRNDFDELRFEITLKEKSKGGMLWIDLMHITPQDTAEEYDGCHYPRFAECHTAVMDSLLSDYFFQDFLSVWVYNYEANVVSFSKQCR